MSQQKTAVLCIGSVCRGDDGVASLVAEHLRKAPVPVFVLPDPSLIYEYLALYDRLIIVDAIPSVNSLERGEVREYRVSDGSLINPTSGHALDLVQWLALAQALGHAPREVLIFGITGEHFQLGTTPSQPVRVGAARCAKRIQDLLAQSGEESKFREQR